MKSAFSEIFDEQFAPEATEQEKKMYPYRLKVALMYRRTARHEYFEFTREMGMANIDKVFNKTHLPEGALTFCFPERWMNCVEEQTFFCMLAKNPSIDKITEVNIITHSPLIISGCVKETIRICKYDDDEKEN